MSFVISALSPEPFAPIFALGDAELTARGMRRVSVDRPGYPCRVSLRDSEPGEVVLLLNYEHQSAPTPYRASHAIFVRQGAVQARPRPGEVPPCLRPRLLSLRGFDEAGILHMAEVVDGAALEAGLHAMLGAAGVAYVHIHNARHGCYLALARHAQAHHAQG